MNSMRKLLPLFIASAMAFLLAMSGLSGQTTTDGIMMPKGDVCFALMGEKGTWDRYWEGTSLIANGNIGTFSRTSITAMAAYGISNRIMVLAQLPYVSTSSTGGQLRGVSGLQDIGLALKGTLYARDLWKGTVFLFGVAEYSRPVTNYLSDYMPYSIGLGTDQVAARLMAHYLLDAGLYVRATAAHVWRGYTKVERDYYYQDGSVYSQWMDVPHAVQAQFVGGCYFLDHQLQLELQYSLMHATSGDDIRRWNSPQPTNRMNADQVGGFLRYYVPGALSGLSFIGGYQYAVSGRNMGQTSQFFTALTYQFNIH